MYVVRWAGAAPAWMMALLAMMLLGVQTYCILEWRDLFNLANVWPPKMLLWPYFWLVPASTAMLFLMSLLGALLSRRIVGAKPRMTSGTVRLLYYTAVILAVGSTCYVHLVSMGVARGT